MNKTGGNMKSITLIAIFWAFYAQFIQANQVEKDLETEIAGVTVFLQGAQVKRTANIQVTSGKSIFKIINLSPYIDEKSIRVKGHGPYTIQSVNYQKNFLNEIKKDEIAAGIALEIEKLRANNERLEVEKEILEDKVSFYQENKNISGNNQPINPDNFEKLQLLYFENIEKLKLEIHERNILVKANKTRIDKLQEQVKGIREEKDLPSGEIIVTLYSKRTIPASQLTITYLVENAGWNPGYDLRVHDLTQPVLLAYKASVYQNTGVDWNNVKLTFSNATPNSSGTLPYLQPYFLSPAMSYASLQGKAAGVHLSPRAGYLAGIVKDASTGDPLIGANIVVKGTTLGTVADMEGRYSLVHPGNGSMLNCSAIGYLTEERNVSGNIMNFEMVQDMQQLDEMVVVGYGSGKRSDLTGSSSGINLRGISSVNNKPRQKPSTIPVQTALVKNQTSIEFEIKTPYSIKSGKNPQIIEMETFEMESGYEYQCIPKLDPNAYLMARVMDWKKYNLLDGEVNLYFENTFVGKSLLDTREMSDTLEISLGTDKNIQVKREKLQEFSQHKVLGNNKVESISWKISVKNNKPSAIHLKILDQIPVSLDKEIEVDQKKTSNGTVNKKGEVTWDINLKAGEKQSIELGYDVKYPSYMNVIVE
jgi:hypothetical protein